MVARATRDNRGSKAPCRQNTRYAGLGPIMMSVPDLRRTDLYSRKR
jgi:hypothetical protein